MKMLKLVVVAGAAMLGMMGTACAEEAPAKRPVKVLMIGNSFSISAVKELPPVAKSLDLPLDLVSLYIGGCSLERHMKNVRAPETNPYRVSWSYVSCAKDDVPFKSVIVRNEKSKGWQGNIPSMLKGDKWDVVTIQQASHFSWVPESYEPFGSDLIATIKELAPQAKILVQQTWTYTPWDKRLAKWNLDQNSMFTKLEAAYDAFAARHGLDQIRMGKAVQRYRAELPVVYTEKTNDDDVCGTGKFKQGDDGAWRPDGDVFHLNARGDFLQGLVWTAKIFNADVTKSTYVPKCLAEKPERAALMRKIASELR